MDNVVGFVGYECEDVAIYLAKILRTIGKNIAIVDRTDEELICTIFEIQAENEKNWKEGEYRGILISNKTVCHEDYDFIFYLFGYRLNHPKLYECGTMIMVTDGLPAHMVLLRKINHWECKKYLVMRNLVPMKHTEAYLAAVVNKETEYFSVPYEEKDIRCRCNLGPYTGCEVRRLSLGMQETLIKLTCNLIPEYKEKDIRRRIKKI